MQDCLNASSLVITGDDLEEGIDYKADKAEQDRADGFEPEQQDTEYAVSVADTAIRSREINV
eukprot:2494718-Rhodomonas_salina.2